MASSSTAFFSLLSRIGVTPFIAIMHVRSSGINANIPPFVPTCVNCTITAPMAALFRTLCIPVVLLGGLSLFLEGIQYIEFEDVALVIGALVYLILYFTVIVRKIHRIANEDLKKKTERRKKNLEQK